MNKQRRPTGLDALAYDRALAAVAENHSHDMDRQDYVGHVLPNGEGLTRRYDQFCLDCVGRKNAYYTPRGRLAASERALAEFIVAAWMDSPGQRETSCR